MKNTKVLWGAQRRVSFYIFILLLLLQAGRLRGQDTVKLKAVEVFGKRLENFTNDINLEKADSFVVANSAGKDLGQMLTEYSNLNIKTYGYGGMANLSVRNGNSYQTAVLWNGFSLVDPLNGGVNLSLIPVYFIDNAEVHYGGETSLFGSGAMGGVVNLNSKTAFNRGTSVSAFLSAGSFSSYKQGITLNFSKKKYSSSTKIFHRKALNDFPFANSEKTGNPVEYQKNAQIKQLGIMQKNAFMLSSNQLLNIDLWWQQDENHIPATVFATTLDNNYTLNKSFKALSNYAFFKNNFKLHARAGLILNSLNYYDKGAGFEYLHRWFSFITEAVGETKILRKQLLMFGLNNTFNKGISESLQPEAQRNTTALFLSYRHRQGKNLLLTFNAREEINKGDFLPPTFSAKASYTIKRALKFFVSFSKNYRLPTFNDLYWSDYASKGNPALKPERGYTGEGGALYSFSMKKAKLTLKTNYYQSLTINLIHWTPVEGIWTPENLDKVSTKGLETSLSFAGFYRKKSNLKVTAAYTFTKAVLVETDYQYADDILGKQLIFTPENKGNIVLRYIFNNYFVEYSQGFTGRVYYTSDNSQYLEPYTLADFGAGYNFSLKSLFFDLAFRAFNIWNVDYHLMPAYAMPGINFEISLKILFKTKKDEKK